MSYQTGVFLKKLRGMRFVHRWNFAPSVLRENVAEHSFYVAVLAAVIAEMCGEEHGVVLACAMSGLMHDAEESVTGDLPALVKRHVAWDGVVERATRELFGDDEVPPQGLVALGKGYAHYADSQIKLYTKLGDLFAAALYAKDEIAVGNRTYIDILRELNGVIAGLSETTKAEAVSRRLLKMLDLDLGAKDMPAAMSHL